MHYLYVVTNQLNGKIYIGQTVDANKRWTAHKSFARNPKKTGQYIHRAMAKYGVQNFIYEVIATCRTQEDANITEDILIKQYDSRAKDKGYNLNAGGFNGEHSEETKEKIRQATIRQIHERGHPAQGNKWTKDQKANLSLVIKSLDKSAIYTEEVRQQMSESHLGHTDSEETKRRKAESAKLAWAKRKAAKAAK